MYKLIKKSMLALALFGTLSLVTANTLEGPPSPDSTSLENPPVIQEGNQTIETPPNPIDLNVTEPNTSCEYGEYYSPFQTSCVAINPPSQSSLTSGVWLDVVVNKDTTPPTPTSQNSGCHEFSMNLNVTSYYKLEDNVTIETETPDYAYYDESTGRLELQFYSTGTTAGTSATGNDFEEIYMTQEGSNTFLLRYDYPKNQFFLDGFVVNQSGTCSDYTSSLVFENDYFNPNLDTAIQVTGQIIVPDSIDPEYISVQAVTKNWNWVSQSQLDVVDGNRFTLGFDTTQEVAIQVNFSTANDWYEFYLNEDGTWKRKDYSNDLSEYLLTIDESRENVDFNISAILAAQVSLDGNITYDAGSEIFIEMINMQNGQYFGWQNLSNSNESFSIALPSTEIGDKYVFRINVSSQNKYESYFVDFRADAPKLVPDTNIEWNSYVEVNGELEKVDNPNYDGTTQYMWLPDFEKTGFYELKDSNQDTQITKADVAPVSLSFLSDALDSQFYVVEGNVTVAGTFNPRASDGTDWSNVSFEVINKNTGAWITWAEVGTTDLDSSSETNTFAYKIKLDKTSSALDVIIRVYYNSSEDGISLYNNYFLQEDGTLVSERNVEQVPVLKDYNGEDLVINGKNDNQCWSDGNFWWQEPSSTTGNCYDGYPNNWLPNAEQSGYITLSDANTKQSINIDFVAAANNAYKVEGEITLPNDFVPSFDYDDKKMIMIEVLNAETGFWLGSTNISENAVDGKPNTYKYALRLDDVDANTTLIVKLIKDTYSSTATVNTWEAYYLIFNDDANLSDVSLISENSVQWVESDSTDDFGYKNYVPDLGDASKISFTQGSNVLTINVDYTTVLANYANNRLAITGSIVFLDAIKLGESDDYYYNNVRVEIINALNGDWIGSSEAQCSNGEDECTQLEFDVELPKDGNYSVKVVKNVEGQFEEFYYNFGNDYVVNGEGEAADKLVNGQKVQWVVAQELPSWGGTYKNYLADPMQTGWLDTTLAASTQTELAINFSAFEASQLSISGVITVAYDFNVGSLCTNSASEIKRCSWEKPENVGFDTWYGSKNLRVEAIDAETGIYLASMDLRKKVENTNDYEYKLSLGDKNPQKVIFKVAKETSKDGQWKFDEIYYDFDNEKLIDGKRVQWLDANTTSEYGYKLWMPNPEQTTYKTLTNSLSGLNIDISQLGANDKKIKGSVTFKSDFDLMDDNTYASINAIDAQTGMQVANANIEDDGSYELNLGEEAGSYILQVNYSYNDNQNWENSFWKNKYYDFGEDGVYGTDDHVLNESDVRWVPKLGDAITTITSDSACWQSGNFWDYDAGTSAQCYPQPQAFVPNVGAVEVLDTLNDVNIDLSVVTGHSLTLSFANLPANATNKYVLVVNPTAYTNVWEQVDANETTLTELKNGNYTIEFGYDLDNSHKHFFIKDADTDLTNGVSAVSGDEVRFEDLGNNAWGPNAEDTTYVALSEDTNIAITLPVEVSNTLVVNVTGLENDLSISSELRSVAKPYGKWDENTSDGGAVGFTYTDLKDGEFILSFNIEYSQYVYDAAGSGTLKKDPEWIAKNATGTQVCGGTIAYNNCDWANSSTWNWLPDVTPLTLNGDASVSVALPTLPKVSFSVDLGSDYANESIDFSVWQYNGNSWNYKRVDLNSTGEAASSMKVSVGENYIVELWAEGLGGFSYGTSSGWTSSNNVWQADATTGMWGPKAEFKNNIAGDTTIPLADIGQNFNVVNVKVENLDTDGETILEDVWISLESDTAGYFGNSNANWEVVPVVYSDTVRLKVPSGNYKLLVYPANHRGGYANDDSSDEETITVATKLLWTEADIIDASSDTNITVTLPSTTEVGEINGTVTCGSSDCSGWIDAYSVDGGKGAPVNTNGVYSIKGLNADTYELTYWSYTNNVQLSTNGVVVTGGGTTPVDLLKSADTTYNDINGTVTTSVDGAYMTLIETNGTTWRVVATTPIESDTSFNFGSMPKVDGKEYYVAGTSLFRNISTSAYEVKYASATSVLSSSSVTLPDLGTNAGTDSDFTISVNQQ